MAWPANRHIYFKILLLEEINNVGQKAVGIIQREMAFHRRNRGINSAALLVRGRLT